MIKNLLFIILSITFAKTLFAADVTVLVTGVDVGQCRIYLGYFNDPNEYPSGRQKAGQFVDCEAETVRMVFTDLPDGKYAFAAFQDNNNNEKLDKNFFGIPTEKYGFSGKQVFGEPDFADSAIMINSTVRQVKVHIK